MSITLFQGRSGLLVGALAGLMMAGWSLSSHAQVACTTDNWSFATENAVAGTQGPNNRRYGGPCGLRANAASSFSFVRDDSPAAETSYIARFYAFLDNVNGPAIIFQARDTGERSLITVTYNEPTNGALALDVRDADNELQRLVVTDIGRGWHSIEIKWEASDNADIRLALNTTEADDEDFQFPLDTSGLAVSSALLGIINGDDVSVSGTADFDDFDSRRISRPGRLCRGLTVPEGTGAGQRTALALADVSAVFAEVSSFGVNAAGGQPDFDENGAVNLGDVSAIFSRVSAFQTACDLNR